MRKLYVLFLTILTLICICTVANAEWKKEGDYLFYYQDGEKLTGTQVIEGDLFAFTDEGYLIGNGNPEEIRYYGLCCIGKDNIVKTGWQKIDDETYYFSPESGIAMESGSREIDGVRYCFDKGKLIINDWLYSGIGCYGDKDGKVLTGYQEIDGYHYLFDEYGYTLTGFQFVDGKTHYFTPGMSGLDYTPTPNREWSDARSWYKIKDYWYYFDPDTGVMLTGNQTINEHKYEFDATGKLKIEEDDFLLAGKNISYCVDKKGQEVYDRFVELDGYTYFWSRYRGFYQVTRISPESIQYTPRGMNVHEQTFGFVRIENEDYYGEDYYYYFDEKGHMVKDAIVKVWEEYDNYYYFDTEGKMYTGWLEKDNEVYYFAPEMVTGEARLKKDGEYSNFVFDESGKLIDPTATGWVERDSGWMYILEDGTRAIGWLESGNDWYYMNDSGIMQTGWVSDNGIWYYFNDSGTMVTGWVSVEGTWYYFQPSGAMMIGWMQDGDTWYYFDLNGVMATGNRAINGTEYSFDASGAWVENAAPAQAGWVENGGAWYYYSDSGTMTVGWMADGGTWYYFNDSGAMATGWVKDGGAWYYFNDSGAMATGWVKDGGAWYYFNASGAMVTGWKSIGGTWYYFKSSGAMATGWLELGDTWYWFDNSGAMATGWKEISGQWEMFADSGVWLYTWQGN